MNGPKLIAALTLYDARLANSSLPSTKMPTNRVANSRPMRLSHCRWMCQEMLRLLNEEDDVGQYQAILEKGMRWLGFIQGVLWIEGYYTIDEMREHNR